MFEFRSSAEDLQKFCERARACRFVTIDTEFLREKTYYPKLCLLQMAIPTEDADSVTLFDTLAPEFSIEPLAGLLRDRSTVKVLHAARQDLEIFLLQLGTLPEPVFDTQIAAMVCGYGDQVGYETLAREIAGVRIDRSSKITDWSRRPLTTKQLRYAASDVDHLRDIYTHLAARVRRNGRRSWIDDDLAVLTNPSTYKTDPNDAWLRIKRRGGSARFQSTLRELAKFRELLARKRDLPRNWIIRDEALLELAGNRPLNREDLQQARFLPKKMQKGPAADGILAAVKAALDSPLQEQNPKPAAPPADSNNDLDLLKVLLKHKAKRLGVAERLIATTADLEEIAADKPCARPLQGWRKEHFGKDAQRLCRGQIALTTSSGATQLVSLKAQYRDDLPRQ